MNKKAADSMREAAWRLTAWASAISNLNQEVGVLIANPMAREVGRLLVEAEALDPQKSAAA